MQEQLGMCVLFGFVSPAFDFACVSLLRVVLGKIANYIFIKLQTFFDLVPESAAEHGNHGTLLQEAKNRKK